MNCIYCKNKMRTAYTNIWAQNEKGTSKHKRLSQSWIHVGPAW